MASVRDYLVQMALGGRLQGDWFPAGTDPWTDPAAQETMLQKALANPAFLSQANQNLGQWNLDASQLDKAVPDPIKGSLIPSGQDLGGMMLALAPLAAMVGGFAGVGGLSNAGFGAGVEGATAAGAGAETGGWGVNAAGAGEAVSGAYAPAAGELAGAASTYGAPGLSYSGQGLTSLGQVASGGGGSMPVPGNGGFPISDSGTYWTSTSGGTGLDSPGLFGLTTGQTLGAASTLGSLLQGGASLIGANTQANAANRATDAQVGMFNTLNAQGQPYREAGYKALGTLTSPDAMNYFTHQFNADDLQKGLAPGYEFMRDQGMRAATNAGNVNTGLAGNTQRGLIDYATNYALNAGYQPAFNNYQTQQTNIFNRLSSIAGLGQVANQQSSNAGSAISPGIAQSTQNYGTALGGGFVGAGNALAGGLNNAASWYALPSILNMGRP